MISGMPIYNAQVILPFFTNLPTDVIVNNFHFFTGADDTPGVADAIDLPLANFLSGVYTITASNKPAYVDWTQAIVKVFNMSDPPPRVPEIRSISTTAGSGVTTIPTEVACVATWRAAAESGVRYQSLYNRIYLGAIMNTFLDGAATDQFPRFNSTFVGRVNAAMSTLYDTFPYSENPADLQWVQVSKAGGVTLARPIVGGWVDNGPDTQRRRSVDATLRSTWSI